MTHFSTNSNDTQVNYMGETWHDQRPSHAGYPEVVQDAIQAEAEALGYCETTWNAYECCPNDETMAAHQAANRRYIEAYNAMLEAKRQMLAFPSSYEAFATMKRAFYNALLEAKHD